jgi:hypothetical protein
MRNHMHNHRDRAVSLSVFVVATHKHTHAYTRRHTPLACFSPPFSLCGASEREGADNWITKREGQDTHTKRQKTVVIEVHEKEEG